MSPRKRQFVWFGALYIISLITYVVVVIVEKSALHLLR